MRRLWALGTLWLLLPAPAAAQLRLALERALERVDPAAATRVGPCAKRCPDLVDEPFDPPALRGAQARLLGAATGLGLGLALGSEARAAAGREQLTPPDTSDALLAGASLVLLVGPALVPHQPASEARCTAAAPAGGLDVAARRALRAPTARGRAWAHELSWATFSAAATQPFGLVARASSAQRGRDALVVLETMTLTLGLTQATKHLVRRPRPYAAYCAPPHAEDLAEHEAWLSFFSGHASGAVAAAVAAGTLADLHRYPNRRWVWASGLTLAAATGVLRVRADQHWLSDVLVGAAAGALAGALVPRLHRPDPGHPQSPPAARATAPALPLVALPLGFRGARLSAGLSGGLQLQASLAF